MRLSSIDRFVWSRERLTRGEIVQAHSPDELPDEAGPEREDMQRRGVHSMLLIPVRSGEGVIGGQIFEEMEKAGFTQESLLVVMFFSFVLLCRRVG